MFHIMIRSVYRVNVVRYFQLFDYDTEIQPILEVLVGKTIEQALIEVLEEEEISALKEQQRRFLELRMAEEAEEQRLAEEDRRRREEKVSIFYFDLLIFRHF